MKRVGITIFLVTAGILLAACAQPAPEPVSYTVDMSEYSFSPDTIEAKVGQQVTLEVLNKGVLTHEIMIGRDVKMTNNRPDGYQTDMFATAHVNPQVMQPEMTGMDPSMHGAGHTGFMVELPKTGDSATITFKATEDMLGEWEIGCFSQDGVHYDAGMKGRLIVKP